MSLRQYPEPKAIIRVPQELWDLVTSHLPAFDAGNAARAVGFELHPRQEKQSQLWKAIFRNNAWTTEAISKIGLSPVLVGYDFCNHYGSHTFKPRALYLILIIGDSAGDEQIEMFLQSLRLREFHDETVEVVSESGITLKVTNIYQSDTSLDRELVSVRPQKISWSRRNQSRTEHIYWQDSKYMQELPELESMARRAEESSKLQLVLSMCGLTLSQAGRPEQHQFNRGDWSG